MTLIRRCWFFSLLLVCLTPASAFADTDAVPVRVGSHDGYGRVVLDMPDQSEYHLTQQGQHVVVQFNGDKTIGSPAGVPRNVLGITGGAGQVEIVVAPGSVLRDWRLGNHIVIDVVDAGGTTPLQPSTNPASAPPQAAAGKASPSPASAVPPAKDPAAPPQAVPTTTAAPAKPVKAESPSATPSPQQAAAPPKLSSATVTGPAAKAASPPIAPTPSQAVAPPGPASTATTGQAEAAAQHAVPAPSQAGAPPKSAPATLTGPAKAAPPPVAPTPSQAVAPPGPAPTAATGPAEAAAQHAVPAPSQAGAPPKSAPATLTGPAKAAPPPVAPMPSQTVAPPKPAPAALPDLAKATSPPAATTPSQAAMPPKPAPASQPSSAKVPTQPAATPPQQAAVQPKPVPPATPPETLGATTEVVPQPALPEPQHTALPANPPERMAQEQPASVDTVSDAAAPPAAQRDSVLEIPFNAPAGAAAFRRDDIAVVVFDQRHEIDTAALRDDPVFGSASVQSLPTATVLRVRLEPGAALSLSQTANVWRITAVRPAPNLQSIPAILTDDRLVLSAAVPGTIVTLADPDTGATLLIGTQRKEGQGVPVRRRSAEFALLPTWQGVVVEAISDTLVLRATQSGFVLSGGHGGLALSPASDVADLVAQNIGLTRRFEFPALPAPALMQRLRNEIVADATTAPLARGPRRQAVARTMISLGLGAEAQAVLQLAAEDDPHEATSPDNAALTSIAALLAHRPDEATGLNDPRLADSDDIALWRGIRRAELREGAAPAAVAIGATLPVLLGYPAEMRDRMLPLAAETLVAGGEIATATALLDARKGDASLDLARGMLQEARANDTAALATYDRLAQSRDASVHARAAVRAVELRLASGQIDARQAADRLDSLLYAWRGDSQERLLREHLAELRARTGAWRTALGLLRETEAIFPDDKTALHAELTDMFASLLRGDTADALPPLDLVALVEENADLLPAGPDGEALEGRLADRLLALDLPKRAGPVLDKLMQAAPTAIGRASFGARLASLRLREGDTAGVLAALDSSAAADLPVPLIERRTLLAADANARRGDTERALSALAALASPATDEARATILERANDWPAAQRALADYVGKTVPPEGRLDDSQRRTLLRLATAAARAGDEATLAALRQREGTRMESGPLADMFRLLTADQVRNVGDLKRAGQEATLARQLPSQLKALPAPAQQLP